MSTDITHELIKQLKDSLVQLEQLESALAIEKKALTQNKPEQIRAASERKITFLKQLETAQQRWQSLLFPYGFNADRSGIEHYLGTCTPEEQSIMKPLWQSFNEGLKRCHAANQVNAQITQANLGSVQRLIKILQGQSLDDELYDVTGQLRSSGRLKGNVTA